MHKQEESLRVIIIQQGVFLEDKAVSNGIEEAVSISPFEITYGFCPRFDRNGTWIDTKTIGVSYKHGKNQEVAIDIPHHLVKDYHVGYFMKMYTLPKSRKENFSTENRFINLDKPEGKYVQFPITNIAPYPYKDHLYQITLHNLNNPRLNFDEKIQFGGKVTIVYYGFTNSSSSAYLNDRDLPWSNYLDQFQLEGTVQVYHVLINNTNPNTTNTNTTNTNNTNANNSANNTNSTDNPSLSSEGVQYFSSSSSSSSYSSSSSSTLSTDSSGSLSSSSTAIVPNSNSSNSSNTSNTSPPLSSSSSSSSSVSKSNSSNSSSSNSSGHKEKSSSYSVMNEIWVRVPKGKNLLWRVGYDRFDLIHSKPTFTGHFESETLFFSSSESQTPTQTQTQMQPNKA